MPQNKMVLSMSARVKYIDQPSAAQPSSLRGERAGEQGRRSARCSEQPRERSTPPQSGDGHPPGFYLHLLCCIVVGAESPREAEKGVLGLPLTSSSRGSCPWPLTSAPCCLPASHLSGPVHQPLLSLSGFLLQLALRGPAGPMGLTGRPGPVVSRRQGGSMGVRGEGWAICPLVSQLLAERTHFKWSSAFILALDLGWGQGPGQGEGLWWPGGWGAPILVLAVSFDPDPRALSLIVSGRHHSLQSCFQSRDGISVGHTQGASPPRLAPAAQAECSVCRAQGLHMASPGPGVARVVCKETEDLSAWCLHCCSLEGVDLATGPGSVVSARCLWLRAVLHPGILPWNRPGGCPHVVPGLGQ